LTSRALALAAFLAALGAGCSNGKDTDPTTDPDDTLIETDGEVVDLDGTLAEASRLTATLNANTTNTWVDLLPARDAIDPVGDRDFFLLDLVAGVPYQFWADANADLLCDTVLWIYPPGATTERDLRDEDEPIEGDVIAGADDMPYRISGSDPSLVFVPPESGSYTFQVIQYGDAMGGVAEGGPWCDYMLRGLVRSIDEVECNDDFAVVDALRAAGEASDTFSDTGLPGLAASPAVQPIGTSVFNGISYASNVKLGESFAGTIEFQADNDVWRFRFGELDGEAGGHFWLWSLWETQPTNTTVREHQLTLFDEDMRVLARTNAAIPDGNHGFAEDGGILYPVQSNTTYYVRVSSTSNFDAIDTDPPEPDRTDGIEPWEMLPGDLVITEVMADSMDCLDPVAQFVEVLNTTPYPVYINGITVDIGGDTNVSLQATSSVDRIQPGQYMVLMRGAPGGTFCYSTFPIYFTTGDRTVTVGPIRLVANTTLIDEVDVTGWDFPTGASLQVRPGLVSSDHEANDEFTAWCEAAPLIFSGANDRGTPGLTNDCGGDTDVPVDTEVPVDTDDTDVPFDTDVPVETEIADTDVPVDTEVPEDTDIPVETDAPVDTEPLLDTFDSEPFADTDTDTDTDPLPDTDTDTDIPTGYLPGGATSDPSFYAGLAHGYGNGLVKCPNDAEGSQLWVEKEDNDEAASSNLMRFCAVGTTSLYVSRLSGFFKTSGLPQRFMPADPNEDTDITSSDVFFACGDGTSTGCPDADYFVIRQTSGAGPIAGKRLTIQVQAKSVGSFAVPEIFVFGGTNTTEPIASSNDLTVIEPTAVLSDPDPVVQLTIPSDVSTITVLIAPTCATDDLLCQQFWMHPNRQQANAWFLRAMLDEAPTAE
jgi:hypothetical protein